MSQDFSSFVERYQLIYEKDPNSKVFAPLAEAYRRMGLLEEAIDLAERGVKKHPSFASGRVALGKCFAQRGEHAKAVEQLEIAVELSPENLLAHQIIADSYLKLKKFSEALNAYKMILFLNPDDAKAAQTVFNLETQLYQAESKEAWAEEEFSMERITEVARMAKESGLAPSQAEQEEHNEYTPMSQEGMFDRELALLDARLDRGDWTQGKFQLEELIKKHPSNPELIERKNHMIEMTHTSFEIPDPIAPMFSESKDLKIQMLEKLLTDIDSRRKA